MLQNVFKTNYDNLANQINLFLLFSFKWNVLLNADAFLMKDDIYLLNNVSKMLNHF